MPLIAIVQGAMYMYVGRTFANTPSLVDPNSDFARQLYLLGAGGIVSLVAGYVLFLVFFTREGIRYFRAHTEIALARKIHQALVPEIQQTIGAFEIYGASVPSGEVGGDLVDLLECDGEWTAYVGDVSGHGVSAGVLMAMFKTAVRTRMLAGGDAGGLLEGVNQVLYPLKTSNMFVTAGFLHCRANQLTLSLAGHPALIHYHRQSGEISEYPPEDLPLGILAEQTFTARSLDCNPGDILLLLTDGITEVFGPGGAEMGIEPIKREFHQWVDLPLPEVFQKVRASALHFGKQQDDQTLLLVRRSNAENTEGNRLN